MGKENFDFIRIDRIHDLYKIKDFEYTKTLVRILGYQKGVHMTEMELYKIIESLTNKLDELVKSNNKLLEKLTDLDNALKDAIKKK